MNKPNPTDFTLSRRIFTKSLTTTLLTAPIALALSSCKQKQEQGIPPIIKRRPMMLVKSGGGRKTKDETTDIYIESEHEINPQSIDPSTYDVGKIQNGIRYIFVINDDNKVVRIWRSKWIYSYEIEFYTKATKLFSIYGSLESEANQVHDVFVESPVKLIEEGESGGLKKLYKYGQSASIYRINIVWKTNEGCDDSDVKKPVTDDEKCPKNGSCCRFEYEFKDFKCIAFYPDSGPPIKENMTCKDLYEY